MKKVLLISYAFPPMAAVGGYRTIKLCKYLPDFGWHPVVLTVKKGFNYAYDNSLLENLDPALKIYRSGNLEPHIWWDRRIQPDILKSGTKPAGLTNNSNIINNQSGKHQGLKLKQYIKQLLSLPDINNFWIPFGVFTGLKAIRKEKIDIIYSSSPPASAHLIGYFLSILSGRPLVIDMRDLWTKNENYRDKNLSKLARRLDRYTEKRVVRRSSSVITSTKPLAGILAEDNKYKNSNCFFGIMNGLDPDDFRNIIFPIEKNKKFTILHLGSMYGNRNPHFFFNALLSWIEKRPEVKEKLSVNFIGNTLDYSKKLDSLNLKDVVNFIDHIPHGEVLTKLWEANMLLLILGFEDVGKAVIPAKLYEYVVTGRPILAFVPSGEASKIIKKYRRGLIVSSPDLEKTCNYLNMEFDNWRNSETAPHSEFSLPSEFNRKMLIGKFAEVFNTALAPDNKNR